MILPHLLPDRAVLIVRGEDRFSFLQGLVTNHLRKVEEGETIYAALLTPQGKFLHDFFLVPHDDEIWLEMQRDRMPDLQKRLEMYRLRAKVSFEASEMPVGWSKEAGTFRDPRHSALGFRQIGGAMGEESDYETHRLMLGIPEGNKDLVPEKSLLLEYGIDQLHGVDFAKGCYVGQEVTARTKHRAQLRKMVFQVTGAGDLPPPGTKVMAGEREVGELRSSKGTIGLALLNAEEVEKSPVLTAEGVAIAVRKPDWFVAPL